ncbi:Tc toxin subunit A [Pseudomonas sp. SIMBA_059]
MKAKPPTAAPLNPGGNTRLLRGLVLDSVGRKKRKGRLDFIDAMAQMGIGSVFDIIGQPKSQFVARLGAVCDADGALAYDNAQCYAAQIGSLYREHQVSSGRSQPLRQVTGVRALLESGTSYSALFNENWDQFCKVGALAALDSPVAYLRSIYRLATRTLEVDGQGTTPKILLDTRRPDLKDLLIDHDSTFKPRSMLELVNDILKAGIKRYLQGKPDQGRPIYDVLAERRHPFIFPYHFAHHQCLLALGGKKPALGELNYKISMGLPIHQRSTNDYGALQNTAREAQRLLSGLGPQQQHLLLEPSLFSTYYLTRTALEQGWAGVATQYLSPLVRHHVGYLVLPGQPAVASIDPAAEVLVNTSPGANAATLTFSKPGATSLAVGMTLNSTTPDNVATYAWRLNFHHTANAYSIIPKLQAPGALPANGNGYSATFNITLATGTLAVPVYLSTLSLTLVLDEFYVLSDAQRAFFQHHYGVNDSSPLTALSVFEKQTEANGEEVEAVLSQHSHYPRLSPNCPSTNLQFAKGGLAGLYGACYVNGHGSDNYDSVQPATVASIFADRYDNAMGLKEVPHASGSEWYLTKTSLNRFDRLQRMIRLQRWTGLGFAELDTLVISVMRSEGVANLGLDFNVNTVRALGVYRHLSARYGIKAEEFAALMHHLTPFATGDRVPLFDKVFNTPTLFDTPLVLDQQAFTINNPDTASKKTIAQLCAGLGLQFTGESLGQLLTQTQLYVGPLKRDLATVSAVYRQARVAQMFGLSVEEALTLVSLLGQSDYQRVLCRGSLSHPSFKRTSHVTLSAYLAGHMRLDLDLVVDSAETGALRSLLPGSVLKVMSGLDFVTLDETRSFSIANPEAMPDYTNFLKNADGTTLTLAPLHPTGGVVALSGKKVTQLVLTKLLDNAQTVATLNVKCGLMEVRELKVLNVVCEVFSAPPPDMLDLLMQLDWLVTWLKDTQQTVAGVAQLLGVGPGDYLPREGLVDRLGVLAEAARGAQVTDAQILALNLPTHETGVRRGKSQVAGNLIDWRALLLPVLDAQGLVKSTPLELVENTLAQLQVLISAAVASLALAPAVRAQCVEKLSNLLLAAHDRQLRLVEALTQEMINLPMDRAQVVVRWAQTSVWWLLSTLLNGQDPGQESLLAQLQRVMRYGQAAVHLKLSTAALRLFLVRPDWLLGLGSNGLTLSLDTLYLLHSYTAWFNSQGQAEEALLGYFILVNPAKARLKTKALRNALNNEAATALASLLKWSVDEIKILFEHLPQQRACTMAEVDWIRRCQATSSASGLSVVDLLRATALHSESPSADWQAVGEAAVAASR